jgi:hypothetical protein
MGIEVSDIQEHEMYLEENDGLVGNLNNSLFPWSILEGHWKAIGELTTDRANYRIGGVFEYDETDRYFAEIRLPPFITSTLSIHSSDSYSIGSVHHVARFAPLRSSSIDHLRYFPSDWMFPERVSLFECILRSSEMPSFREELLQLIRDRFPSTEMALVAPETKPKMIESSEPRRWVRNTRRILQFITTGGGPILGKRTPPSPDE